MKSSAAKLLVLIALVIFPPVVKAIDVSPTATPSATLAPTITPSVTPTPTNSPPICLGLSANPGAGAKPLTVNFACAGYDANNDITAAEFGFGAGQKQLVEKNIGQYGSFTASYTYQTAGTYNVTCHVRDNNASWSDYPPYCTYTVVVSDNALTPTPIRTIEETQSFGIGDGSGASPALSPSPTGIIIPTEITPTPTPLPGWWAGEKIRQLIIMLIVSGVTIAVALALHAYFDRR